MAWIRWLAAAAAMAAAVGASWAETARGDPTRRPAPEIRVVAPTSLDSIPNATSEGDIDPWTLVDEDRMETRRPRAPPAPAAPCRAGSKRPTGVVNLNTATRDQLLMLPGVGPRKADRILAHRERRRFRRVRDLRRVRGFGRRTVLRLTPMLTTEGDTTLAPR